MLPADAEWDGLAAHFALLPGTRQIFVMDVDTVQTSCGYGVPLMTLERERPTLTKLHQQADPEGWIAKQQARDHSIDGLPVRTTDRYFGDA